MHAARSDLMTDLTRAAMHAEATSCYAGLSTYVLREQLANDPGCWKCFEAVHAGLGSSNKEFTARRVRSKQVVNYFSWKHWRGHSSN